MGLLGLAIGGIGSAITAGVNNLFGQQNAARNAARNFYYGEKAAANADARTRALYKDIYAPKALLKQYQEAGLSPSMMFGGTPGQGGMAGAMGSGAGNQGNVYMPMSMLESAQVAKIMAETEKTKAETEQVKPLSESTVVKNLADAGHADAAAEAAKAAAAGQQLDNYVKKHTQDANIYTIYELAEEAAHRAEKTYQEARTAKALANVNEATLSEQITIKKKEVEQITAAILNTKAATELSQQQKKNLQIEIGLHVEEVCQGWQKLDIEQRKQTTYENYVEAQCNNMEKQISAKLKELGMQKTGLIVNAIINGIKAACMTAQTTSSIINGQNNEGNYILAGQSVSM